MPDYNVPSWLLPPSQAQEAQLKQYEDVARERAGIMLRKQIGFARMKDEAAQMQAQGVDPLSARKTALLNNAHLLFADNPNAVVNLLHNDQLQEAKEQALEQKSIYQYNMLEVARDRLAETKANNERLDKAHEEKRVSDELYRQMKAQFEATEKGKEQEIRLLNANINFLRTQATVNRDKTAPKLPHSTTKEIDSIYKQIDTLQKQHDELAPQGMAKNNATAAQRARLRMTINSLKTRAKELEDQAKAPADESPVGAESTTPTAPSNDRVRVKKPDGTVGTISRDNLDAALKAGWTEVK